MDLKNIDYKGHYGSGDFNDVGGQIQSEILSATLWKLREKIGKGKITPLIIGTLLEFNSVNIKNHIDALLTLYNSTYNENFDLQYGFTEGDQCDMLDIFYNVYGDLFLNKVTFIPSSADGDVFIKDNATDDGMGASTGVVHDSPSLWNRHNQDFESVHQAPTPVYYTHQVETNYIHVKLNGNFCDLASVSKGTGLKMQVHFSINGTAFWDSKWTNDNVVNYPKGDLIGILDFETGKWTDDYGNVTNLSSSNIKLNPAGLLNAEAFITVALPYRVAPFRSWSPLKFGGKATLGFHAILFSAPAGFDPLDLSTLGTNVENNTRIHNNIALKNTIIVSRYCCPTQVNSGPSSYTPMIIPPLPPDPVTPDPDPEFTIEIDPSTHDPNPEEVNDPDYEVLPPVSNDYFDYGQVIFALDDVLFAAWQAGGGRGQGFTINSNNEIEVTGRNFFLEGLPYPVQGLESIIGFNFINNTLPGRTGFDIVQSSSSGKEVGRVHVEVREASSQPRSQKEDKGEISKISISIYPNPVNGDLLHIENLTQEGTFTIFGLDSKIYTNGKFAKDQKSIDISALNEGVYFLQFRMGNGEVETKKLIKL